MDMSNSPQVRKEPFGQQDQAADRACLPHAAVQIYSWICLSLAVQMLNGYMLTVLAAILIIFSFKICRARFMLLLRRTRWIIFSMLIIYAYTTPGAALWPQFGSFSPVADGIADGLLQLTRLLAVLAGLSILLTLLSQSQLVAGLYSLSRPFCIVGLSRERFAVRLALTLRYAESAMQQSRGHWRDSMEQMLAPGPSVLGFIDLQVTSLCLRDWMQVVAVSAALLGIWLMMGAWL